jgi:Tfp pilus assembly protein PilO
MIDFFTPKKAALAGGVALLLVLLVGWFLLVSPQRSKAAALDRDISEGRANLALAHAAIRQADERHLDLERLTKAMPSEFRQSATLRDLADKSIAANIRINSVTPQAATLTGSYYTIPIAITVEGRTLNIARFLRLLNGRTEVTASKVTGAEPIYTVPQIQLTSGDPSGLLQGTMTVDAYAFSGAAATPSATPEVTPTDSSTAAASVAPTSP